ncbi:hypothetical protein WN51_10386 [Melipona quadrifasciata]|uniref:Uncharacterized protein n=1 Tax=Melipona quadrifasciata TaxID=166423 RepID=A0A0N0BI08_9HYME|nr:hypothetical protein WN51_10386 [Melipona quadrifasciata]
MHHRVLLYTLLNTSCTPEETIAPMILRVASAGSALNFSIVATVVRGKIGVSGGGGGGEEEEATGKKLHEFLKGKGREELSNGVPAGCSALYRGLCNAILPTKILMQKLIQKRKRNNLKVEGDVNIGGLSLSLYRQLNIVCMASTLAGVFCGGTKDGVLHSTCTLRHCIRWHLSSPRSGQSNSPYFKLLDYNSPVNAYKTDPTSAREGWCQSVSNRVESKQKNQYREGVKFSLLRYRISELYLPSERIKGKGKRKQSTRRNGASRRLEERANLESRIGELAKYPQVQVATSHRDIGYIDAFMSPASPQNQPKNSSFPLEECNSPERILEKGLELSPVPNKIAKLIFKYYIYHIIYVEKDLELSSVPNNRRLRAICLELDLGMFILALKIFRSKGSNVARPTTTLCFCERYARAEVARSGEQYRFALSNVQPTAYLRMHKQPALQDRSLSYKMQSNLSERARILLRYAAETVDDNIYGLLHTLHGDFYSLSESDFGGVTSSGATLMQRKLAIDGHTCSVSLSISVFPFFNEEATQEKLSQSAFPIFEWKGFVSIPRTTKRTTKQVDPAAIYAETTIDPRYLATEVENREGLGGWWTIHGGPAAFERHIYLASAGAKSAQGPNASAIKITREKPSFAAGEDNPYLSGFGRLCDKMLESCGRQNVENIKERKQCFLMKLLVINDETILASVRVVESDESFREGFLRYDLRQPKDRECDKLYRWELLNATGTQNE